MQDSELYNYKRISSMKDYHLITLTEICQLKEDFYSCQLGGVGSGVTFAQYLKDEIDRRTTKNVFLSKKSKTKIRTSDVAKELEGKNIYLGDYYIHKNRKVCSVFYNAEPSISKGHKEYTYMYYDQGNLFMSAYNSVDWNNLVKYKL